MAGKHHKKGKQGLVSWVTSLIALLIGVGPAIWQLMALISGRQNFLQASQELNKLYNPLSGDQAALKVGYGSLVGGIVFKVATSELARRAKIRSIVPALHA